MSTELQDAQMIKYIVRSVSELQITERQQILQMILNAVPDSKIQTKGDGTQVKISDIPRSTMLMIHNYISTKIASKMQTLEQCAE
jgi:hypothetical protein